MEFWIRFLSHILPLYKGPVERNKDSPPVAIDEGAPQRVFCPAVVEGESAVEAALSSGMFPVVDKAVDVFAVPSASG